MQRNKNRRMRVVAELVRGSSGEYPAEIDPNGAGHNA